MRGICDGGDFLFRHLRSRDDVVTSLFRPYNYLCTAGITIIIMSKTIWIILVFIAGALLPIQAGLNARIGKEIQSPVWASFFSFAVGLAAMSGFILLTRQKMNTAGLSEIPLQYWIAGALGAFYVTVIVLAFPRIGAALTFGLIVAGQLTVSLLLDHFKMLVPQQQSISLYRLIGLLLIISGVVIIRKF